jgi:Photoprotection regulator fluorescence recovery protein
MPCSPSTPKSRKTNSTAHWRLDAHFSIHVDLRSFPAARAICVKFPTRHGVPKRYQAAVLAAAAETVRPVTLPTHGNDQGFVRRDLAWSRAEKAIARRAFQSALEQELEALVEQAKRMAQRIEHPSELWKLEEFLTRRGNEIDRKYDYNIRFCRPCSRGYSRNTD